MSQHRTAATPIPAPRTLPQPGRPGRPDRLDGFEAARHALLDEHDRAPDSRAGRAVPDRRARGAHRTRRSPTIAGLAGLAALVTLVTLGGAWLSAPLAHAQRVSGTIAGKIVRSGEAQAAAKISATNLTNGAVVVVTAGPDGEYTLAELAPGQYLLTVTAAGGQETTEYIELGTGQTLQVNLDVAVAKVQGAERIEVTGKRFDVVTSEVATDVSREQIANLPQNSRNFLNFAQLAPGVRLSTDELNKNVSSGGLEARQTNVFVDGVSLKNNIIEGGVVGQDASRGNPFPQLAVAGFRVLTQNFKAEYEQAGTAIISTVTRSGGNDVHGELYGSYQDRNLTAIDPFAEALMQPKPDYTRYQLGGLLSGPIVKDRVFALATYEGNYQNRAEQVALGDPTEANLMRFGQYQGSFGSPFRQHLGFAKLTALPAADQTVDLSFTLNRQTDIRTFGGQISFENAENVRNNVYALSLRHQWRASSALVNEATVQFLNSQFNPSAERSNIVGQEYVGVVRIGGRDTDQDIVQRTIALRDDVTFPSMDSALGAHQLKVGAKLALQNYKIDKKLFGNPLFKYRVDPANGLDFDIPFEAQFGVGDPAVQSSNTQIGLYVQDDWQVNDRLAIDAGIRWDIETNPLNNDYTTPAEVRAAVTELAATVAERNGPDFFRVENYLTDGSQRPIFLGAIQPRLGASYDLRGDQHTVLFAGAGRYFDRTLFNTGVDERLRLQYGVRTFRFSRNGAPRDGNPTIIWDPAFLSRQGLQGLIDQGIAPAPEIFLLENDTKPLHTDQLSAGVRQVLGPVTASVTFSHIRGENGVGFYPANREVTGNRNSLPVPGGFGQVLISADDIQSRFTGVYVTAEKPYSEASKWGFSATYTLGWSKIRGDTFNFDFPTIKDTPLTPGNADERHRLVLGAIGGLPYGFKLSTLIALGTGLPYNISDASAGFGANFRFRRNGGRADGFLQYKQVDLRLAKELEVVRGQRAAAFIEVFNLFNSYNYGNYEGFLPPSAEPPNPKFGEPTRLIGPTRALQFGLTYAF
jgi:TonB dependent receptor/Carboxypeptidase regulatory-like domain